MRRPPTTARPGAAGADDENGAVAPLEGTEPGGIGIRIDRKRGEGVRVGEHPPPVLFLLRPGEAETGVHARQRLFAEARRGKRRAAGFHRFDDGRFAEPGVGWSSRPLPQQTSVGIAKPGAAAAAATIDSDEERRVHSRIQLTRVQIL